MKIHVMQTNRAPVTMSVGENVEHAPTTGNDAPSAPTTKYAHPTQIGTGRPNHVSIDLYNKAIEAIGNWDRVHKKDVEEKHKLFEELYYEKKDHNMGRYPDELTHCKC